MKRQWKVKESQRKVKESQGKAVAGHGKAVSHRLHRPGGIRGLDSPPRGLEPHDLPLVVVVIPGQLLQLLRHVFQIRRALLGRVLLGRWPAVFLIRTGHQRLGLKGTQPEVIGAI